MKIEDRLDIIEEKFEAIESFIRVLTEEDYEYNVDIRVKELLLNLLDTFAEIDDEDNWSWL
jgi:hypothetical protein